MKPDENIQPIDWQAIRESLDWNAAEKAAQRLQQRATQYAAPLKQVEETTGHVLNVLTFTLGTEQYGVDVMAVRAVRPLPKVTPVPGTPPFYSGVVNLRGQIVTVFDLRRFFDIATPHDAGRAPRELIIVNTNQLEMGLLASHVKGVMSVPAEAIQQYESVRYAYGVTAARLVILDIAALFEDERLIIGGQDLE